MSTCPIEELARSIGDKWSLLIIRDLMKGCHRFGELQQSVGSISPRTLSARLSKLETLGIVERRVYNEIPPRVEYTLTTKGRALLPVFSAMRRYAERWL